MATAPVEIEVAESTRFEDRNGKNWDVSLDLAAARRVDRSDFSEITDTKFSILEPTKDLFMLILMDLRLVMAITWAVVQPQVKKNLNVDPEKEYDKAELAFLSSFDAPAIRRARNGLWRAVADFFPEHATGLLTLMSKVDLAHRKVADGLATMGDEVENLLNMEIDQGLDKMRKDLQALQSTPEKSPGEPSM